MAGVGVGDGCRIHWTGLMGTGLGGGLSCVMFAGTMVTLGVNAGGMSVGTLGDGAEEKPFGARLQVQVTVFWDNICWGILSDF